MCRFEHGRLKLRRRERVMPRNPVEGRHRDGLGAAHVDGANRSILIGKVEDGSVDKVGQVCRGGRGKVGQLSGLFEGFPLSRRTVNLFGDGGVIALALKALAVAAGATTAASDFARRTSGQVLQRTGSFLLTGVGSIGRPWRCAACGSAMNPRGGRTRSPHKSDRE
jgi:hypothetical protein